MISRSIFVFLVAAILSGAAVPVLARGQYDPRCESMYETYVHDGRLGGVDDGYRLIAASAGGDLQEITRLLKLGIDPDYSDAAEMTPLAWAARCGRLDAAKLLLTNGADINASVSFEVNSRYRHRNSSALIWAASNDQRDVVQYLLAQGADPRRREEVYRLDLNASGQEVEIYYAPGRRADEVTDDPGVLAVLGRAMRRPR